jgi:hypothetical protein
MRKGNCRQSLHHIDRESALAKRDFHARHKLRGRQAKSKRQKKRGKTLGKKMGGDNR